MEWVALGVSVIAVIVIGGTIALSYAYRRRIWRAIERSRQPYELHRKRYELTGDEDELEAMRNEVRKED